MMIKKKSLIVTLISSLVVSSVLVLTLIAYLMYIEMKGKEFKSTYQNYLSKINAKIYSKHIEISKLSANIETSGALKGKPVLEGIVKNTGDKDITNLIIKVNFLDKEGAYIYEALLSAREPSLGSSMLSQVAIPYLPLAAKTLIKGGDTLPFKKVMPNCPSEILVELKKGSWYAKGSRIRPGKLAAEVISADF